MRSVYYLEDNFCQIEILPIANWDFYSKQMARSEAFAAAHRTPEGHYTAVYRLEPGPIPTESLALDIDLVSAVLAAHLEPFEEVSVFDWDSSSKCKSVRAFGFDHDCAIFLQEKAAKVSHIFLELGGPTADKQKALFAAFQSLEKLGPFLYADWGWNRLYRLQDAEEFAQYLGEREKRFAETARAHDRSKT